MKLIIEIDLDKKDWEPTTAQVRTILRRTANRLEQCLRAIRESGSPYTKSEDAKMYPSPLRVIRGKLERRMNHA
jgi:hypothetical protein